MAFVLFTVLAPSTGAGQDLVINEVVSSGGDALLDEDAQASDWIEIHNPGSSAVQLEGHGLTDDEQAFKWRFPSIVIPSGGHLIVFASGKDRLDSAAHWETVVDRGDEWRFIVPSSEPPAAWRSPGYDDAAWSTGPTGIGYGDDDDLTQVPAGTVSVYARKTFSLDDPAKVTHAYLDVDYDDAFVAYLNGTEIARANIGTPGTPPLWTDVAPDYTEPRMVFGGSPFHYPISGFSTFLRAGENVLAIQLHNTGSGSSDLTLIPFLTLGMEEVPAGARGPAEILRATLPSLHANFKIDADGETITLRSPDGTVLDSLATGSLPQDISLGRYPDGTGDFAYHAEPTPGRANANPGYPSLGGVPAFSHAGGFHAGPIAVALSTDVPSATIYYTLDGSLPTELSPVYTTPISIATTTVVRAKLVAPNSLPGGTATHSYIIGESFKLPVISLSTNPENFFDDEIGIYVLGTEYDPSFPYFGSNIWEDWERPVHLEFFEPNGTLGFGADAGVSIFGGWSRGNPQRSLAFFARKQYGQSRFEYRIFPEKDIDRFESFVLRNSGNDWQVTHFRDAMMTSLLEDLAVDRQAYRPVHVYINGEYWGILNLREKVSEHFLESNHPGVDSEAVDLLDFGGNVLNGDADHYTALLALLEANDPSDPAVYAQVKEMVDIDAYIDYQASQIYFDNTDWPGNNIKFWRPRVEGGKWRWILFDTDFGFGLWNGGSYTNDTLAFSLEPAGPDWPNPPWSTFLFRRLVLNEEFVEDFVGRFSTHLNTIFKPTKVTSRINEMQARLSFDMPAQLARWGGTLSSWLSNVQVLRNFANFRVTYVRSHLSSRFGLGISANLKLDVSPPGGGVVEIQRIAIPTYPWTGAYFRGVPIALAARPAPGYRFVGWTGLAPEEPALTSLTLTGNLDVSVTFELDCTTAGTVVINEVNYNAPEAADPGDWVELHNRTENPLDLSGWTFRDESDAHIFTLPSGTWIGSGAFLVLCSSTPAFAAHFPSVGPILGDLGFSLAGGGEMIRLLDAAGEVVDALTYDDAAPWPVEADGNGATLALRNPLLDNTAAASWGASASGGTPGERNDTYEELTGGCAALWRPFLRGDSNADGQVDLSDAIGTLRFLFQEEEVVPCLDAADANDDGTVDLSDSLATIFHLFLGTVELPAPGTQACGVDPTADALSCASHPPCAE